MQSALLRHARLFAAISALALITVGTLLAANPEDVERARATGSCVNCDLREANLGGFQLAGGDFSGANFNGASLYGTNLEGADLSGATFEDADLKAANLNGAVNAALSTAATDERTTCPNGANGPCQ
jgi:uncharacterized protein YjbI with pentapeptide repeats